MRAFFRRLRARIKYRHFDRDLAREIEQHRAMAADHLASDGDDAHEARARATRLLGNTTLAREDARAVWIARWIEQGAQDIRYAVRGLRRAPAFSVAALTVLIAAIGLNTSLFTTINAVLLRPWPVSDPGRVASVYAGRGTNVVVYGGWPAVEYRYLRDHASTIDLVAMRDERVTFDFEPVGESAFVRIASDNYFSTLGIPLQRGRGFERSDDEVDAPRAVVVLSDSVWRTHYGARESLVGETIRLNKVPFMVIGIAAPRAVDNPLDPPPAAWLPFASLPLISGPKSQRDVLESPTACCQDIAGRLRAGVPRAGAAAEIDGLSRQFRTAHDAKFVGVRVTGTALFDTPRRSTATPVFGLLFAGVLLVLALACANVGNLVLARSMARASEVRVRLSLGAGRARIVRQLLTEGLVLSALAALVSAPLAYWLPTRILRQVSPVVAWGLDTRPDGTVFAFVALLVAVSAMLFALAPALRVTRSAARLVASQRTSPDRGTARLRLALLSGQIAIGAVLLVASALLGRAVTRMADAPIGFDPTGLSAATVWLPGGAYDVERAQTFGRTVLSAMTPRGAPAAATIGAPPFQIGRGSTAVRRAGDAPDKSVTTDWEEVSPEFFGVMGIPIIDGRPVTRALAPTEIIVSEQLADALGLAGDAIGRDVTLASGRILTIVGVAANARLAAADADIPTVYRVGATDRARDLPASTLSFVLRGDGALASLSRAAAATDPRVRVTVRPVGDYFNDQLGPARVGAVVAGSLGMLAALVSAIGVFGVFSYLVASRQREIGIRLALGAGARAIAVAVLRSAMLALLVGLAAGLLAALVLVPALAGYLYGMSPFDPIAFGAAAALLGGAALAATAFPLRRALRVDPTLALRQD